MLQIFLKQPERFEIIVCSKLFQTDIAPSLYIITDKTMSHAVGELLLPI